MICGLWNSRGVSGVETMQRITATGAATEKRTCAFLKPGRKIHTSQIILVRAVLHSLTHFSKKPVIVRRFFSTVEILSEGSWCSCQIYRSHFLPGVTYNKFCHILSARVCPAVSELQQQGICRTSFLQRANMVFLLDSISMPRITEPDSWAVNNITNIRACLDSAESHRTPLRAERTLPRFNSLKSNERASASGTTSQSVVSTHGLKRLAFKAVSALSLTCLKATWTLLENNLDRTWALDRCPGTKTFSSCIFTVLFRTLLDTYLEKTWLWLHLFQNTQNRSVDIWTRSGTNLSQQGSTDVRRNSSRI